MIKTFARILVKKADIRGSGTRENALGRIINKLGLEIGVSMREKTFAEKFNWFEEHQTGMKFTSEAFEKLQYFVVKADLHLKFEGRLGDHFIDFEGYHKKFNQLIEALQKYEAERNLPNIHSVRNKPEWDLTQKILTLYWIDKHKFISRTELAKKIFGEGNEHHFISRFSIENEKSFGQKFSPKTVAKIEDFCTAEFTGDNLKYAQDAIEEWRRIRDPSGLYVADSPESVLGNKIRNALEIVKGKDLSMTAVGRYFGWDTLFTKAIRFNRPIKPKDLLFIAKVAHIRLALSEFAPQYIAIVKALGEYRRDFHYYYRVVERQMVQMSLSRIYSKDGYAVGFTSPRTRKMQQEILMRQFCGRDALTGKKINGAPDRHHIEFDKSKCLIKDLAPLSPQSHAIITAMYYKQGKQKEAVEIIQKVKEAVETKNLDLLRGIWDSKYIKAFEKDLQRQSATDINYYTN